MSFVLMFLLWGKTSWELPLSSRTSCSLPPLQVLCRQFRDHMLRMRILTPHASCVNWGSISSFRKIRWVGLNDFEGLWFSHLLWEVQRSVQILPLLQPLPKEKGRVVERRDLQAARLFHKVLKLLPGAVANYTSLMRRGTHVLGWP